ncbi:probable protein phosphatase 2C 13 [Arachis ipaensis]|uniref:probable protein phosphatase 2C 13 n=1 Tax=Arachis ipaensis TaxID=130454 RepID=UPI000A2B3349|nr:probable protein phosphatase 2C 13 [Arachis ipaensis]
METGVLPCSNLRRQWEERWSKGKGKELRTEGRGLDAAAALGWVAMARRWWRLQVSGSAMGRLVRDGGSTLRGDARGRRWAMEDFYDIKTLKIGGHSVCLLGVFDGHGGFRGAEYLKEHLFDNLMKHPKSCTDAKLAISETYQDYRTIISKAGLFEDHEPNKSDERKRN